MLDDLHTLARFEIKEHIDERIWDNQGIVIDEISSKMSSHGKRICKNDSKPNLFFVTESGVL
jgi:hypothetical protein